MKKKNIQLRLLKLIRKKDIEEIGLRSKKKSEHFPRFSSIILIRIF